MSGTTSWTQRGAAGLCLLSLGTIGFLAGSSYSSTEVKQVSPNSPETAPQVVAQGNDTAPGQRTMSTKGEFNDGSTVFGNPLLLGATSICGSDGDFESCSLGYLGGGNSGVAAACDDGMGGYIWANTRAGQAGQDATFPTVSNANPNGGLQHLHHEFDVFAANNDGRNWARSADLPYIDDPSTTVTRIACDVWISATNGQNTYRMQPQAPTEALLTTIMQFDPSGTITVGDDATGPDDGFFTLAATSTSWVPGEYKTAEIYIDNANNRIVYFYDGAFVRSTGAGEGGDGGGIFAGSQAEQLLLRWDPGASAPALDDGVSVDIDNACIETGATVPPPNGACCVEDPKNEGLVLCTIVEESVCLAKKGATYAGDAVSCEVGCPSFIECLDGKGDCFEGHGGVGCDDAACCDAVCTIDPFCCDVEWGEECVAAASAECPPPSACPAKLDETGATGTCQDFSEANASSSVTGLFRVADDFVAEATGNITQICFWGAYLPADLDGADDDFTVTYYTCVDGVPGEVIRTIPTGGLGGLSLVSRQNTEFQVAAAADIYEYVYNHIGVPVEAGEKYFVEIKNNTPDTSDPPDGIGDTNWFWEWADAGTSPNANGLGYQTGPGSPAIGEDSGYARYDRDTQDYSFCLNIVTVDQTDVCEVPPPAPCELDVSDATDLEGEFCMVDPDINFGCNANVGEETWTDIVISGDPANPSLLAGVSFADGGFRDIDWVRFTVPASADTDKDLTVTVCTAIASELPMAAAMFVEDTSDGVCGTTLAFGANVVGFECASSLAIGYAIPLDDGKGNAVDQLCYIQIFAEDGAGLFEGAPCGGDGVKTLGNDYLLNVSVTDQFDDCFPDPPDCPEDLDGDDMVGFTDLTRILSAWGPCDPEPAECPEDLDDDGMVGFTDLTRILSAWGPC